MKRFLLYIFLLPVCFGNFSCKKIFYRQLSVGMESTVHKGQSLIVNDVDNYNHDDIAVFNYYGPDYSQEPDESGQRPLHWGKRLYRIVALSGDVVTIKNGNVYVNERPIIFPSTAKSAYVVKSKVPIDDFSDNDILQITTERSGDTFVYHRSLSFAEADQYRHKKPAVISVVRLLENYSDTPDTLFASLSRDLHWNMDDYGPLHIPSAGETITVNEGNYKLYKNIPGIKMGVNTIKEKLYFLLGDNFYEAEDSRYIGLISQSNMYGIVKIK